ncbi:MAG: hypothetical protein CO128_04885 [Ignavibacteriales bacterium CG_4_9_14_3_um_filter_30_11]|nr:MAG: hypothetical protein CO128_04885 [Ignavibacteriales bacterium CG_4_9_14_3_um_filter_30_11]
MKKHFSFILILLFTLPLWNGCKLNNKEIPNLSDVKAQIEGYHKNGKYDADLKKIFTKANLEFAKITSKENSLVIFDIDETTLSNYQFGLDYDFGYNEEIWDEWVNEKRATAIKEVKDFYNMLVSKGFRIAFITGRNTSHYNDTKENLISEGYTIFDTLITRKMDALKTTALIYKSEERQKLVDKGYEIVATVGDQYSDILGANHGIQIKIPNYQYIVK